MSIHSYVVADDWGFAPNPFHGICTLATCKPRIRKKATVGDLVVGTGSVDCKLRGCLVYAMYVDEVLTFDKYWIDTRFRSKKPVLNGSLIQLFGDNIYHKQEDRWIQERSHHWLTARSPNPKNITRDTGTTDHVLIGSKFVYYGVDAVSLPSEFQTSQKFGVSLCINRRGEQCGGFPSQLEKAFEDWLNEAGKWGLQGLPLELVRKYSIKDLKPLG